MQAAEALLIEQSGENFTLAEVAQRASVSTGAIYLRFDNKDALIQAVQSKALENLDSSMDAALSSAMRSAHSLKEFIPKLVQAVAESLREYASILRPMMYLANTDDQLRRAGRTSHDQAAKAICGLLLLYRREMKPADPERAVDSAYQILYSTLARILGFGTEPASVPGGNWDILKEDLAEMLINFLVHPDFS